MKIGLQIGKQTGVIISSADSASAFHKLMKIRKIGQEKNISEKDILKTSRNIYKL